ncbi:peptidyl-prolyl cis-trans isomerase [Myxococcota bacterium]|nr:peptidyl-prolyl cis-trans isomerase [Myxococcota bacterium]
MRRLLRSPALHFALIGSLLYAGAGGFDDASSARDLSTHRVIEIDAARLEGLRADWRARTGRLPDPATLDALVEMAVDEEVLFREARAMNLHLLDPLVRRRLVQNMRFVNEEDSRDDEALFEEALELGMDLSDIVVRRRLVQIMQLRAQSLARLNEPTQEEMQEYLDRHSERYRHPARVRLDHVYLSRDRRGDDLESDAQQLLERLRAHGTAPDEAREAGDPFLHPSRLPLRSEREFTKTFGPEFAAAVIDLSPDEPIWLGPFQSAYGAHLVWVHERTEARDPALEEVERQVREALFEERGRHELERVVEGFRRNYSVNRWAGDDSNGSER